MRNTEVAINRSKPRCARRVSHVVVGGRAACKLQRKKRLEAASASAAMFMLNLRGRFIGFTEVTFSQMAHLSPPSVTEVSYWGQPDPPTPVALVTSVTKSSWAAKSLFTRAKSDFERTWRVPHRVRLDPQSGCEHGWFITQPKSPYIPALTQGADGISCAGALDLITWQTVGIAAKSLKLKTIIIDLIMTALRERLSMHRSR